MRVVELVVAVAMVVERFAGGGEDSDGPKRPGSRQEQIECVLERNMRLSWERKERARATWEDMFRGRMNEAIASEPLSWSTPGVAAVDVNNEEVSQ